MIRLKTISKGYASFDWTFHLEFDNYLAKLDILLNSEKQVDALSALIHKDNAYSLGKKICIKLRKTYPNGNNLICAINLQLEQK